MTNLIMPGDVGRHIASIFYVEYSNTGNVAMPAPVLLLESSNGRRTCRCSRLNSRCNHPASHLGHHPQGYSSTTSRSWPAARCRACSNRANRSPCRSITPAWSSPGTVRETQFSFDLQVFTTATPIRSIWASLQSSLQPAEHFHGRPGDRSSRIWLRSWATTWGGYVQMLDNEATYLGKLGENVTDISQLWQFAVLQADNALLPAPQFDTDTDISLPTPGTLSLDFGREFLAPIHDRANARPAWATAGPTTGSIRWPLASDGTVTVTMPGGSQRIFQPDSRGSDYFDQPGDYGVLTSQRRRHVHLAGNRRRRSKPSTPTARSTTSRTPTAIASRPATPAAYSPA